MNTEETRALAEYYSNTLLIERKYKASVYLENKADIVFWDKILQEFRPGNYYYISYTRDNKILGGCKQCLKFKGLLSEKFFICIDTDIRFQSNDNKVSAKDYILQTYTYSWENHFCYAERLQKTMEIKCPEIANLFSFPSFLSKLSEIIFERFLYFLILNKRNFIQDHSITKFLLLLPQTHSPKDFEKQGSEYLKKIKYDLAPYVDATEETHYKEIGINRNNTYLHIKGHYIYNLVKFIGHNLFRNNKINLNFEEDILRDSLQTSGYWQMEKIKKDIESF